MNRRQLIFQFCGNIWDILVSEIQISLVIQYSIWKPYLQSMWSLLDTFCRLFPYPISLLRFCVPRHSLKLQNVDIRQESRRLRAGYHEKELGPRGIEPAYGVRTTMGTFGFLSRRKISLVGSWCSGIRGSRN